MHIDQRFEKIQYLAGDCCLKANCRLPLNNHLLINPQSKNSINIQYLASPFVNQFMRFSPSVDFGGFLDQDFDIQSSFGVTKVQVESNDVSKTGTWSKIHWANLEIFTLFWRNSYKITIFQWNKVDKKCIPMRNLTDFP